MRGREMAERHPPSSDMSHRIDLDRGWRGGYHYEVEVLDAELREWEVHIDAKTGKVQKVERDWFD